MPANHLRAYKKTPISENVPAFILRINLRFMNATVIMNLTAMAVIVSLRRENLAMIYQLK